MEWLLLAEDSSLQTGATLITVLASLVSCGFNWLQQRDRLKFDFEKSSLREANERHTLNIAELKEQADTCRQEREKISQLLDQERRERVAQADDFARQIIELRERHER